MRELRAEDPRAERWLIIPEVAPLLFQAGLDARQKRFQGSVVHLQIALEDACATAAQHGQILLCHRGTLDPLAYWLRNGWEEGEFFNYIEKSKDELFTRYDLVLHLQTVASGAKIHYRQWPDAHRPETPEQAIEIDNLCRRVWDAHPRYAFVRNAKQGWTGKSMAARHTLSEWLVHRALGGAT